MAEYRGDELFSDDQVSGRTRKLCEPCRKKNERTAADVFCKDCKQFQCSKGERAHGIYDFMSGHELVDVDQAVSEEPPENEPELDLKGVDKCITHGKTFEFFCVDHHILCCSSCAIELHRKCDKVNELSTQTAKSEATGLISVMTEMKACASSVFEHVQNTKTNLQTQIEDLSIQVDEVKESVVKMFETLKEKVVNNAKTVAEEMTDDLCKEISPCKDIIQSLENSIASLQTIVAEGSTTEIYNAIQTLQRQIEPYQSVLKQQRGGLHTAQFSVGYSKALASLLQAGDTLGSLNVHKIYNETDIDSNMKLVQMTLMTSMDLKKTRGKKEPLYTGLTFMPDGRLVAIDNPNCKCLIMTEKQEKLGSYKFNAPPKDVVAISDTDVAVTGGYDRKSIQLLHINPKNNVVTLVRTIKGSSKFYSICLMNDRTFAVGTFEDKRPVRMISMTGEERDFSGLPEKEYATDSSASTYIRHKNSVVVSDRFEHTVQMYEVKANTCVTQCVLKDKHIKEPRGMCVGPGDCILVCSGNTNSTIVQLSMTGKVIRSHKLDMTYPRSVCVSPDGSKLALSNSENGNKKLNVYRMSY